MTLQESYANRTFQGWAGPDLAREQWDFLKNDDAFKTIKTYGIKSLEKMQLWRIVRKVLGSDTPNYPQLTGDCVSFAAKNCNEYLQCTEMVLNGDIGKFRHIFAPYHYGTGRVFIGRGQLDRQGPGSLGSWQAKAVVIYGCLAADEDNVPKYSGALADKWGNSPGPAKEFVEVAKSHLIRSAAKINNWDELCAAISNGYPVHISSDQGFEMLARNNGFHYPRGNWAHAMTIVGYSNVGKAYGEILNSWDDVHGRLKDFDDNEELPIGIIRAQRNVIEGMLSSGEGYAYSQFDDFPLENTDVIQRNLLKFA